MFNLHKKKSISAYVFVALIVSSFFSNKMCCNGTRENAEFLKLLETVKKLNVNLDALKKENEVLSGKVKNQVLLINDKQEEIKKIKQDSKALVGERQFLKNKVEEQRKALATSENSKKEMLNEIKNTKIFLENSKRDLLEKDNIIGSYKDQLNSLIRERDYLVTNTSIKEMEIRKSSDFVEKLSKLSDDEVGVELRNELNSMNKSNLYSTNYCFLSSRDKSNRIVSTELSKALLLKFGRRLCVEKKVKGKKFFVSLVDANGVITDVVVPVVGAGGVLRFVISGVLEVTA